jgi:hypothetical protein
MYDPNEPLDHGEPAASPGDAADPMAMLAFLQRLVATMSSGGDVEGLMATAPPGFRELFADAERRVQAGETPDLGALLGMFGAGDDEDEEDDEPADAEQGEVGNGEE